MGQARLHIFDRFLAQAHERPEAPALVTGGERLTYAELLKAVSNISALLVEIRQEKGELTRIGLRADDHPLTYAAILACLAQGVAYVPLNRHNPASRSAQILDDAGLDAMLGTTEDWSLREAAALAQRPVSFHDLRQAPKAPLIRGCRQHPPEQMAYLLFTSGSTGRPKGVPIHLEQLEAFLQAILASGLYDFRPEDRFLQMFELTFDLSVFSFLVPFLTGAACVVPAEGMGALPIFEALEEEAISVALMVPSVLTHLEPYFEEIELPHLRYSLFCGEALPQALTQRWASCVPNAAIENLYGPTEATIFCLRYPWEAERAEAEQHNGVVPIGRPLPGMDAAVVAAGSETPLAPGEDGELCLLGPQLSPGYWHNPAKTDEAFFELPTQEGPRRAYRTGDRAREHPQGEHLFLGRVDQQVKIEGHRVELGEIEHHARLHTGAPQAVVIPLEAAGHLSLHLILPADALTDAARLRAYLREQLPPYMIPRHLHAIPALPLNTNGKVDRPALAQALREGRLAAAEEG